MWEDTKEIENLPDAATLAAQLYSEWSTRHDLQSITRIQWRGLCIGQSREPMQKLLVGMAQEASGGSLAGQCALYKAAHAALPLHGAERGKLAYLLMAAPPVSLDWCDVLIEVLYETQMTPDNNAAELLEALRVSMQTALPFARAMPMQRVHLRILLRQIADAGYHPDWLSSCFDTLDDADP